MTEPHSRTLVRGLRILALYRRTDELTQTAIAEQLGLPLPTVTRLCRALVGEGFLERKDTRRFVLGPVLRGLAQSAVNNPSELGRRWMRELNELFDEDVNIAVLDGTDVLYVASAPSTQPLTVRSPVGSRAPVHTVAVGKAMLAELDRDQVRAVLGSGPYDRLTDKTIVSWPALAEDITQVRLSGVARTWEEYATGIASLAIAVPHDPDGQPTALAVTVPTARATPQRIKEIITALTERHQRVTDIIR